MSVERNDSIALTRILLFSNGDNDVRVVGGHWHLRGRSVLVRW